MEELLKEVTLSERRKQQIDSFIQTVTKLLQTVPESPEVEVCRISAVRKSLMHAFGNPVTTSFMQSLCVFR